MSPNSPQSPVGAGLESAKGTPETHLTAFSPENGDKPGFPYLGHNIHMSNERCSRSQTTSGFMKPCVQSQGSSQPYGGRNGGINNMLNADTPHVDDPFVVNTTSRVSNTNTRFAAGGPSRNHINQATAAIRNALVNGNNHDNFSTVSGHEGKAINSHRNSHFSAGRQHPSFATLGREKSPFKNITSSVYNNSHVEAHFGSPKDIEQTLGITSHPIATNVALFSPFKAYAQGSSGARFPTSDTMRQYSTLSGKYSLHDVCMSPVLHHHHHCHICPIYMQLLVNLESQTFPPSLKDSRHLLSSVYLFINLLAVRFLSIFGARGTLQNWSRLSSQNE